MKIETDLRADWPEEAVKATVCAWQKHLDSVAKARRDSHARQKEEEAESDRLREKMRHLGFAAQGARERYVWPAYPSPTADGAGPSATKP